jgi:hypothetical protein
LRARSTGVRRGWGMIALIVNGLSTFGMMLILTYQLPSVIPPPPPPTALALIPFAIAAVVGSAVIAPILMVRVPPIWLISRQRRDRGRRSAPARLAHTHCVPRRSRRSHATAAGPGSAARVPPACDAREPTGSSRIEPAGND